MPATAWMIALRVCVLAALATSAALLVDYTSFSPAFCSPGSGCASVRASGFGFVGGVPVPLLGLLGFGLLYVLSLSASPKARRWITPTATAGGAMAVLLILLQAVVIGHICLYCVVVDVAAIIAAAAAVLHARASKIEVGREPLRNFSWIALGAIAICAPLLWPKLRPKPNVPAAIQSFYVPGKINVVEFADFECPFCRMLHPQLKTITRDYPGQVNFVRMNMPLDRHPQAMDAARAYVCAIDQAKGEEMADALFESEDLSAASNRRLAVQMALDAEKFDACLKDPKTETRIRQEAQILRDSGFQGLPTTYVGNEMIVGAQGEEVFREAFDAAARGDGNSGVPAWAFLAGIGLLAAAAIAAGRIRPGAESESGAAKDRVRARGTGSKEDAAVSDRAAPKDDPIGKSDRDDDAEPEEDNAPKS